MSHVIALAGKGGTGKTTIAALILRVIKERKLGSALIVDADPSSNLAEVLGVKVKDTIGDILNEVAGDPSKIPPGMPKERFIEYRVQTSVIESEGFDILTMGKPEGPGCYCYVNTVLRGIVSKLIDDYDYIIIDNEAGLEHLSRRTTRRADSFLIVSDATAVGLRAATRINALIRELKFEKDNIFLVVNRAAKTPGGSADIKKMRDQGVKYLGTIPLDKGLITLSLKGEPVFKLKNNAVSIAALRKVGEKIWQRNALKSGRDR
ncbi:MAG: AAA family ATPase [Candidatus Omnitrophica bacterium]|nr:AAA family ATPase [Candidatus Omnitrophota bacterium]